MWQLLLSAGQWGTRGHSGCDEIRLGRCNLIILTSASSSGEKKGLTDEAAKILCKQQNHLSGNKNKVLSLGNSIEPDWGFALL